MDKQRNTGFVWGILGNILASLLIAIANILIGKFFPNASREMVDILSLMLPMLFVGLFLTRERLRRMHLSPKAIGIVVVTLVTVLLIVGFGVSIRWLFEGRIETTMPPIYDVYRRIYNVP